ncbi:MAG: hypothetical protein AAF215_10335 [Cyanobacteria bacterium P01_A01_bin.123]
MKSLSDKSFFDQQPQTTATAESKLVKTNPFQTYRDPNTGQWITVVSAARWPQYFRARQPHRTRMLDRNV